MLGQRQVAYRTSPVCVQRARYSQITPPPGGFLRAFARRVLGIDTLDGQRHLKLCAQFFTMRDKTVGCSLQAVVHMHRPHLLRPAQRTRQQQRRGISAAAQGNGKRKFGFEMRQRKRCRQGCNR